MPLEERSDVVRREVMQLEVRSGAVRRKKWCS